MSDFKKITEMIKYRGKSDSCYSVYWINVSQDKINSQLIEMIDNLNKKIKDSYKRQQANDILYSLRCYIEENYKMDDIINNIFFVNKEVADYKLGKEQLEIAKNWNLPNHYFSYSDRFEVEYFYNLFSNEKIYKVLKIKNKDATVMELTENKSRIILEKNISDIEISNFDLICGISSEIKKLDGIVGNLTNSEILEKIKTNQMLKNHLQLDLVLNNLQNPKWENKLVFGKKDISESLKYCLIKTLFCSSKNLAKIKKSITINFEVIIVDKIKLGDTGDIFKKNYDALLGIKYF